MYIHVSLDKDISGHTLHEEQSLRVHLIISSIQFSSVAQSCLTVCHSMNCSTQGLPVHNKLPEFTQTQVHRVSDAISVGNLILCRPLLLLPPTLPSIRVFSNESTLPMRYMIPQRCSKKDLKKEREIKELEKQQQQKSVLIQLEAKVYQLLS